MTKLLDCPICGKKGQPVRNDALVCSTKCRVKKFRLNEKAKRIKRSEHQSHNPRLHGSDRTTNHRCTIVYIDESSITDIKGE